MSVRTSETVLATGKDGSTLTEVRAHGPEGGGSLLYRLAGGARATKPTEYMVSSDFSPGGPSRPQRVSVSQCQDRLAALSKQLRTRGFANVTVNPARCEAESRSQLVVVK